MNGIDRANAQRMLDEIARTSYGSGFFFEGTSGGTGHGYSVLQVVKAFEQASKRPVPYKIQPRRPGDIAECWADPALAKAELGWVAVRGIEEMCKDAWNWQRKNPFGYNKA